MSAEQEPSMSTGHSLLEQTGNCIPAAIAAHLGKQPVWESFEWGASRSQIPVSQVIQRVPVFVQCELGALLGILKAADWLLSASLWSEWDPTLRGLALPRRSRGYLLTIRPRWYLQVERRYLGRGHRNGDWRFKLRFLSGVQAREARRMSWPRLQWAQSGLIAEPWSCWIEEAC